MVSTLDIRAPAEQTEGTRSQVLRWLKAIGETVSKHEPLIEIETDKVTGEVAAPASGVLREVLKAEQEEIAPGDVLGRIELAAHSSNASTQSNSGQPALPSAGDATAGGNSRRNRDGDASRPTAASDAIAGSELRPPSVADTATALSRLSPAVRRLIAERGLDSAVIRGSGEGGRITVDDVLAHESSRATVAGGPKAVRTVPHTAIRKRIAEHMVQSLLQTAPHVTTVFEADMTAVMAHRARCRAELEQRGAALTFTAYFLAAIVNAIRVVPEANSRWTDPALEIYDSVNIGVATALEGGGLVVPVMRNVESRDLFNIAQGLAALVAAAREGRLEPADVRGGTFTISNHGVSGSLLAAPIVINQPQSAILGVGKLEKRAVVVEEQGVDRVVVRPKCYVTLTIDHRVMDGHQANRFLQEFVRTLETWPGP